MQKCLFDWHNKLCAFYMRPQAKQWHHWWVEGLVGVKACVFWVGVVFESRRTYLFHFMPTGHVNNSSLLFHCYFHLATHSEMLVQDFLAPCHYLVVHSLYLLLLLLLLRQQRRHSRITHLIWQTTWCARIVITIHTNDERKCRRQHSRTSTQYVLGDENRKNRCQCQRENRKPYFHWWNKSLFSVLTMFSSQPFTLFNFSCCLRREYALTLFAAFFPQMLSAVNKKKKNSQYVSYDAMREKSPIISFAIRRSSLCWTLKNCDADERTIAVHCLHPLCESFFFSCLISSN